MSHIWEKYDYKDSIVILKSVYLIDYIDFKCSKCSLKVFRIKYSEDKLSKIMVLPGQNVKNDSISCEDFIIKGIIE